MKAIKIAFLLCSASLMLVGCSKEGSSTSEKAQETSLKGSVAAFEEAFGKSEQKVPDFSSPAVIDPKFQMDGIAEKLDWYTSYPKEIGDPLAKKGGTFHSSISQYPSTFRTMGPNASDGSWYLFRRNGSLVGFESENRDPYPELATHWAFSSDKKTVYYALNKEARWSDGQPLVADDFLFWRDMALEPANVATQLKDWLKYRVIKKINDHCISVTWTEGDGTASQTVLLTKTSVECMPSHFFGNKVPENYIEDYNWKVEPTLDAYVVTDSVKGEKIVLSRVENWWGYVYPYNKYRYNIDKVELKVITGGQEILRERFYKQELDNFAAIIPKEWRNASANKYVTDGYIDRWVANYVNLAGIDGVVLNTQYPLFKDVRVRKALLYAWNAQGMIDKALSGEYALNNNPYGRGHIWEGQNFDDTSLKMPAFDPEMAGKLLSEAGYTEFDSDGIRMNKKGERVSFEFAYPAGHWNERFSVLKEEAKKAGIEIVLKLQQQGLFTALQEHKFQAAYVALTTYYEPRYYNTFHSKFAKVKNGVNFWGYMNPEMDKLLDDIDSGNLPIEKRAELTRKVQRLAYDDVLILPLWDVNYYRILAWKWMRYPYWLNRKFENSPFDPILSHGFMWIDEDIKKEVLQAMKDGVTFEPKIWVLSQRYK